MTDEELRDKLKVIRGDVVGFAIMIMILVFAVGAITLVGLNHIKTILCEQKATASCPK